jgi:hypothetical protein
MAGRRNTAEGMEVAWQAWELRAQGVSVREISRRMGLGRNATQAALARCHKEAKQLLGEHIVQQQAIRLEQLETLLEEALAGWRRSQEEITTIETDGRAELVAGDEKSGSDRVVTLPKLVVRQTRQSAGDPAFLGRAREVLADMRRLMGLDAPRRIQLETPQEPIKLYAGFDIEDV